MGDPWQDEGFGGEDDWDEGKESLETDVEEGFDNPDDLEDDESWEEADDEGPPKAAPAKRPQPSGSLRDGNPRERIPILRQVLLTDFEAI